MSEEINLYEYWQVLKKNYKFIFLAALLISFLAGIYSLFVSDMFSAHVVILPTGGEKSGGGLLAVAAQISGIPANIAGSENSKKLELILNSRSLYEELVKHHDLPKRIFKDNWDVKNNKWILNDEFDQPPTIEDTAALIKQMVKVELGPNQSIIIGVTTYVKEDAAYLANLIAEELDLFLRLYEVSDARRNRIFIEKQLLQKQIKLLEAGRELADYYSKNQISASSSKLDVQISVKDLYDDTVGENIISSQDTEKSASEKITDGLQQKINKIEEKHEDAEKKMKELSYLVKQVPQNVYLRYVTLKSDMLGELTRLLSQQYEMAKIEEAKESVSFRVIDEAREPGGPFKPKRKFMVMASFFVGLIFAVFIVFVRNYFVLNQKKYQEKI